LQSKFETIQTMQASYLWSLRLGYSTKQANLIQNSGLKSFLNQSFQAKYNRSEPEFLSNEPHSLLELKAIKEKIKNADDSEKKKMLKKQIINQIELKKWWLQLLYDAEYPLREKMVVFWHNHFVSTAQKVKVNYWIYQHNQILRENAFGNFKDLTKKIIKTNAMVRYLDNVDNKNGELNENLSRELLELFTLGIGNYTENDIKEGAKALAGLHLGDETAAYRKKFEVDEEITYLGKTGYFKADDIVDIIFEQPNIPYFITKKILQWFIYDEPNAEIIQYYGDYFRSQNFEIQPLLIKIFTEEYSKNNAGSKIKDPLTYIFQLINDLNVQPFQPLTVASFLKQQGMDLLNQPNVKGWEGGKSWLSSQVFLQRNKASDLLCSGKSVQFKGLKDNLEDVEFEIKPIDIQLNWNKKASAKEIIKTFSEQMLFELSEEMQNDLIQIIKYDFDASSANAEFSILKLYNYITKSPEFQIV